MCGGGEDMAGILRELVAAVQEVMHIPDTIYHIYCIPDTIYYILYTMY